MSTTASGRELQRYSPEDTSALTRALGACMAVQRTYGRQADDLAAITKVFTVVLSDYEPRQVIQAIRQWLRQSAEFPTPHDILTLLAEDKPLNRDVYLRIVSSMRRSPESLQEWEWDYMAKFERANR